MTMARGHHLIGTTLGSCTLERLLGYGGSSAVFLAQQHAPERKVAIKVFLPHPGMSMQMQRDFYERFLHEAESASQLDHPHILPIYAYGEQNGLPYIIMPYMPGGTLSEYIAQNGPLSLQETCWFLEQISSALDYAHQRGCIHCDVKPANMLLDTDGRIMLSDFGIARMQQTDDATIPSGPSHRRGAESLMGTPDYISPEQALGEPLSGPSDIYSLGVTVFYMLAKQLPFKADTTIALALMHIHEAPPPLALLRLDVTPEIDHVVQKALAKHPEERFQTAGEFCAAFTRAISSTEEWHTASPSSKHALARAAHASLATPGNGFQPALVASHPHVHIKPTGKQRTTLLRLLLTIAALLALLGASGIGTSFLITHHATQTPATKVTPSPSVSTNNQPGKLDNLANQQNWPDSSTFFFKDQQYHIVNTSAQDVALALYANHTYHNFRLTITMAEVHSPHDEADYYGVVFRASANQSRYYLFEIVTSGSKQYAFWRYDGQWKSIATGPAPSLRANVAQGNTITIEAHNNTFAFFINNQPVGSPVSDTSKDALDNGAIGLYVEEDGAEVAFSHLYIESLN
jgi:serine/threonine protein kinase